MDFFRIKAIQTNAHRASTATPLTPSKHEYQRVAGLVAFLIMSFALIVVLTRRDVRV